MAYEKPIRTSKIQLLQLLSRKSSIVDVGLGSKYASGATSTFNLY